MQRCLGLRLRKSASFATDSVDATAWYRCQCTEQPQSHVRTVHLEYLEIASTCIVDGQRAVITLPQVLRDMMPAVRMIEPNSDGHVRSRSGWPYPPCIVIERGESLDKWAERLKPDFPTILQVSAPRRHLQRSSAYPPVASALAQLRLANTPIALLQAAARRWSVHSCNAGLS